MCTFWVSSTRYSKAKGGPDQKIRNRFCTQMLVSLISEDTVTCDSKHCTWIASMQWKTVSRSQHTCNCHFPVRGCRICQALEKKKSSWWTQTILELLASHILLFFHLVFWSAKDWTQPLHTLGKWFTTDLHSQHGSFLNPTHFASLWTTASLKPELNPNM